MMASKIPTICVGCQVEKQVLKANLKRSTQNGLVYRCRPCALSYAQKKKREEKGIPLWFKTFTVKTEKPIYDLIGTEKVQVRCECGQFNRVSIERLQVLLKQSKVYTCVKCAPKLVSLSARNLKFSPKRLALGAEVVAYLEEHALTCAEKEVQDHFGLVGSTLRILVHDVGRSDLMRRRNTSRGEVDISSWVAEQLNPLPIQTNVRGLLKNKRLELDLVIPDKNIAVEYNGNVWHSMRYQTRQSAQLTKRLLCEDRGIRLIQIRDDEWRDKQELVKSLLNSIFGNLNKKYFARKLRLATVSKMETHAFLNENHLMGSFNAGRSLGLITPQGDLVQLFVYKLLKHKTIMDCSRICSKINTSIVGGVSKLITNALRKHPTVAKVLSFVDLRYADGHSLKKIGFEHVSTTLGFRWTDGTNTYPRQACWVKNHSKDGLSQAEYVESKNWYKLYDAGQAKFEMNVGYAHD